MVMGRRYFGGRSATAARTASASSRFSATSGGPGRKSGISRCSRSTFPSSSWNKPGRKALSQFIATLNATRRSQAAKRLPSRSWPRFVYARMNVSWAMSWACVQSPTRL